MTSIASRIRNAIDTGSGDTMNVEGWLRTIERAGLRVVDPAPAGRVRQCAMSITDLVDLSDAIYKAREAYLNSIGTPREAANKQALAEVLWNDKGAFAPALNELADRRAADAQDALSLPPQDAVATQPVAWRYRWNHGDEWEAVELESMLPTNRDAWQIQPLYATPPAAPQDGRAVGKLRAALKAARPEIVRQRDRCNSDDEVRPYENLLKTIDAALALPRAEGGPGHEL